MRITTLRQYMYINKIYKYIKMLYIVICFCKCYVYIYTCVSKKKSRRLPLHIQVRESATARQCKFINWDISTARQLERLQRVPNPDIYVIDECVSIYLPGARRVAESTDSIKILSRVSHPFRGREA